MTIAHLGWAFFAAVCSPCVVFIEASDNAGKGNNKAEELQERIQQRETMLRQMGGALRSIADEGDGTDDESASEVRQMAVNCDTALEKAAGITDGYRKLAVIEEALSHREKWMSALAELRERKAKLNHQDEQQNEDSEPEHINSAEAVRDIETLQWWIDEHPLGPKQAVKLADPTGLRLTHWAASAGQLDSLKYLMRLGANPWEPTVNQEGQNTLHVACISGHAPIVKHLLKATGGPSGAVDSRDAKGMPCLHRAATAGHVEIVQALAQAGGDMNLVTERTGSALHGAAAVGQLEVVELLLELGADPCMKNENGKTPLDRAIAEDEDEIVSMLKAKSRSCKKQASKAEL